MELLRYGFMFVKQNALPWLEDRRQQAVVHWTTFRAGYQALVLTFVLGGGLTFVLRWYQLQHRRKPRALGPLLDDQDGQVGGDGGGAQDFDVCVVGGGPAGLATAYFLAAGGMRVLVLEKDQYPRDKVCGDVVVPAAQSLLKEMGIWQRIMERGAFRWVNRVALVGAKGSSVVGSLRSHRPLAVQRWVLDQELCTAAKQAGAHVAVHHAVEAADVQEDGAWSLRCANGAVYRCSVLVCADGAPSLLARKLGVVHGPPNAVGERTFVAPEAGTSCPCDYVVQVDGAFVRSVTREVDDYLCQTNVALKTADDSAAVGFFYGGLKLASGRVDRCEMRVGGVQRACADRLLVVGDAAGLCDPLTGFGIVYALLSGRAAARTIVEAVAYGDLTVSMMSRYQSRINSLTRVDFGVSNAIIGALRLHPMLSAAAVAVLRQRGVLFFSEWVGAWQHSKRLFLSPTVAILVLVQAIRSLLVEWFFGAGK